MSYLDLKRKRIVAKHVRANYDLIDVNSGACRYNFRCHLNAIHEAVEHNEPTVAMCVCLDKSNDHPFIHFINFNDKREFFDNTLGHWSFENEYYLIRFIPEAEFYNVSRIFEYYRDELKRLLPWYLRINLREEWV